MALNSFVKPHPYQPETGFSITDFQRNTLMWILLFFGVAGVVWQLLGQEQIVLLLILSVHLLSFLLLFKNHYGALITWSVGVTVILYTCVAVYELPNFAFALCLLPLVGVIVFGLVGGLGGCILAAGSAWLYPRLLPGLFFGDVSLEVSLSAAVLLVTGGMIRYELVRTLRIYYENYLYAIRGLEEARQQRVGHLQVQEDLQHANRELARMTKQLKMLNQVAEEARRAKEEFVATVSHELRTPLNMIIGFSEVITQSPRVYGIKLPPTLLADIASIQRNSQHLLELVNDVLDLSQVDMGNFSISRRSCSIQGIIRESFDVIRPLFISKGLYLNADLPDGEDYQIYCDQTRIREVIINLLSNAGRFTASGGVCLLVRADEHWLTVGVQDTGPGISPENQQKLFEPFQQLDSSIRREHGGSGLGLAISKRFVEAHGGKMWLESTLGVGTTFFFSLPAHIPEEDGLSASAAARWVNPHASRETRSRPFKATITTPTPRCVVFEEGGTIQRLFERYLEAVEIEPVASLEEAEASLSESPASLLVINHSQAAELLRSISSHDRLPFGLPVMAFWMPGRRDFSDKLGADRYLVKPVGKEELLGALSSLGDSVKTVLLVDDNPEILQLFGRILAAAERPYQVLRASDGEQGLEMMRTRRPDAVILDLVMPEINGFQVLQAKAGDPSIREIPVIVITAQDPEGLPKVSETVTIAREGGFSSKDLLELVETMGIKFNGLRSLPPNGSDQ